MNPDSTNPPPPPQTAALVDALRLFDSHERGLLLTWATGSGPRLGDRAREAIGQAVGEVPRDAHVATDYTLDWLYAALRWVFHGASDGSPQPRPPGGELSAFSEDIDMLVAWEDSRSHLVLLEAKGFTGWSNTQMASKAKRLRGIFSDEVRDRLDVHFVLVGPARSKGLVATEWPDWMRSDQQVHFLTIDDPGPRRAVQRCDEYGMPRRDGTHWRTIERKWAASS